MTAHTPLHPALHPGALQHLQLANRYVVAPMSRASATGDGVPTEAMARYYAGFATGGFGLIIAEGAYTDLRHAQAYGNQPGLCTDAQEAGWRRVTDAVHRAEGRIILQLIHAGAVSQAVDEPHAPSAVRPMGKMLEGYGPNRGPYGTPKELSAQDIRAIKAGFVQAALRAQSAGFDGVEVHCANGYLLDQFLTPETNLRSAPYGGSVENRIRLTAEIIADIRAATGGGFLTGVRLSQAKATQPDYFWHGGLADAALIFTAVAEAGAGFIHLASEVKGYAYHSSTPDGANLCHFARATTGLPVIANGGLQDPVLARDVLNKGEADFIAIGKAAMNNPDLPDRIARGRPVEAFTYDLFSHGVSIEGQAKWEAERSDASVVVT
jgi:2,4-dienoyl-CoA reductase-like NADH-dependent reductase (Old Yellow Enzyme family)